MGLMVLMCIYIKSTICLHSVSPVTSPTDDPVKSVDDFVPEDALDASFLDDTKDVKEMKPSAAQVDESDR